MGERTIALLSGGMDSTTAMYIVAKGLNVDIVAAVVFDYGQRGARLEYNAAADCLAELRGRAAQLLPCYFTGPASALTRTDRSLDPDAHDERGLPLTWVPARNMIMLALAGAYMEQYGASTLVGGWVADDNAGYPDCREEFLKSAQCTLSLALDKQITILSPVLHLSKVEVVRLGSHLGVPWEHTRSCYGQDERPCLQCDSCQRRIHAFILAGVRDPLITDEEWSILTTETEALR